MKILIVGGKSSIAQALIPVLKLKNEVLTSNRKDGDIPIDFESDNPITIPLHLDALVHTVAHFGGNDFEDILKAENINVLGTLKLLSAAKESKVKHIILISSIYALLKPNSSNYNIYSISKKQSEEVATYFCNLNNIKLTILRPSLLYGNGESFKKHQPIVYTFIDKAIKMENIEIFGNHDPLRNYLHVDDLATVIERVISYKVIGTFNLTNPVNISFSQIANAAFNACKFNGTISFDRTRQNIEDVVFENDETIYRLIDFFPKISIDSGLKQIIENKNYV